LAADVTTTFDGDGRPLEAVLKRLIKEMRRFATVAEKSVTALEGGFKNATDSSAQLAAQQRKTNAELAKAQKIQQKARPQTARTTDPGFIGPKLPLSENAIKNINRAMLTSNSLAKETRLEEEAKVKALLRQQSATRAVAVETKKVAQDSGETEENIKKVATDLPSLRYALYDVANSFRQIAIGAAALSVAPIGFSIRYARDFANVARTNELLQDEFDGVRNSLLEIARETPIPWRDITNIAALAGQLNIAQEALADFTETTAKIAATTNLSVDAAATALGRLDQLIDGVDGQFENLGSAILAVGVSSVSTETQIVGVAQNIASMGNLAGLSASDIVGLSGAIASLGIRPELARGNITRLFSRINQAIAESGTSLNEFARLTGRTAEEFSYDWANNATPVILDFFEGINKEGPRAERTLRDIGIRSVRDIPAILRLAQSQDEVRRLIALSNEEFLLGTKVNEQYGYIAETLAEQINRLTQNFGILAATVGESGFLIAPLVDALNSAVESLSRFAATGAGQIISGLAIGAGLAIAAFSAFGAILFSTLAGMIALSFAVRTAGVDLSALTVKAILSGKAFADFAKKVAGGATLIGGLGRAIAITTGVVGASLAVLSLVAVAWDKYNERARRAKEVQDQLFGSSEDLREALKADGEAAEAGAESFKKWTPEIEKNDQAARDRLNTAKDNIGIADEESDSIDTVTSSLEDQTYAIGENVKERLRAKAIEIPGVQEIFSSDAVFGAITEIVGTEDPFGAIFEKIAQGQGEVVADQILAVLQRRQAEISAEVSQYIAAEETVPPELIQELTEATAATKLFKEEGRALFDSVDGGLKDLVNLSVASSRVAGAQEEATDGINLSREALQQLSTDIFDAENDLKKIEDTAQDFGNVIAELGNDAEVTDEKFQEFVNSILLADDLTAAEKMALLSQAIQTLNNAGILGGPIIQALDAAIEGLGTTSGLVDPELGDVATQIERIIGAISISLGPGLENGLKGIKRASDGAAKKVETLAEKFEKLLDSIFEPVNAARSAAQSIADLGEAYAELGEDALFASDEIQDAVSSILETSGSAEEGVANLNALYSQLAATVGSTTAPSLQFLRNVINQVAQQFGVAQDAVQDFVSVDVGFFNRGIQAAQEEVRTLLDYAGDLDSVISRAFDIRFASTFDIDRIAEAWFDLGGTIEDARYQVEELIASQQDLGADRALKEYFLSVADAYGDTLRAAQLRKEIAELDREQAQNARELAEAQQVAGGDLTTQGPGARQNRSALLDLVRNYQDYITTLAESGASTDELRQATADARQEFIDQATELGFHEEVVLEYAQAFDDVTFAINNVPRNITVDANTNPAIQALNELNAKLNQSIDLARELNRTTGKGVTGDTGGIDAAKAQRRQNLINEINRLTEILNSPQGGTVGRGSLATRIQRLRDQLASGNYATGGFTGRGGRMQPAGIVHRGEYVIPQQYVNQSTGLPDPSFLAQLQNGMRSYQTGGFVGGGSMMDGPMMVELSPYDRKLLENAGNVQLRVDGKVVASATNRSNFNEARRGSN